MELTASILDRSEERRAPWVLLGALLLGTGTQGLFWNAGLGANWLAWDVTIVGLTLALLRRPRLKPTATFAALVSVAFAVALVLHRSDFTLVVALPSSVAALSTLPVIVGEDLGFDELVTLPARMCGALGRMPTSFARTVFLPADAVSVLDARGRGLAKGAIGGLVLGLPAAGFFSLLLAADPGFAGALAHVHARLGLAASFAFHAGLTAILYVFAHALYVRTLREKDDAEPIAAAAPYRKLDSAPSLVSHVTPLTWGLVVAQVGAVFAVFVAVHADTEFGGHSVIVADRSGLTYARHLHAGFYQLLLATLLSVCLVLVGHALLRARLMGTTPLTPPQEPMPVPGGAMLSLLEAGLLVLTGLTLASCMQRLKLYEEAYGATHQRLAVAFIGLAVAGLLLCALGMAVFRSFRGFAGTAMAAFAACALGASFFDADAYVARTNLDRVSRGAVLDERYLALLSADACAVADHPALADGALRARLVRAWAANETPKDVRAFRGFTRCPAP